MPYRPKNFLNKVPKHEQESCINVQPLLNSTDDYQAPLTCYSLSPNSKWVIVRHNIHKIRSWSGIHHDSIPDQRINDWYLLFQMRRELKRAEEHIRAIEQRPDFTPVRHFDLPVDETHLRRHNVSHVRPTDGVFYAGLGSEPLLLEAILYYFSKECVVPYNSMFYPFLCDVSSVLNTNRQRIQRVVLNRRVALGFTLVIYILIFIMFFSLVLSVVTTTSNLIEMHKYKNDSFGLVIRKTTQKILSKTPSNKFKFN